MIQRLRVWAPTLIGLIALGRWLSIQLPPRSAEESGDSAAAPAEPAPYQAEARKLLRDLDAGDELVDGWAVRRVEGPLLDRRILITAHKGEVEFVAWLAPENTQKFSAPLTVAGWSLFYNPAPGGAGVPGHVYMLVLNKIADRIRGE